MEVVVLSPHRDDAAFSCGLLIHALCAAGAQVRIVNVCTISNYAPYLAAEDGQSFEAVTSVRRREDEVFLRELARDADATFSRPALHDLAWQDAPIRWAIDTEAVLAPSPVRDAERMRLRDQLSGFLTADVVLAPLAIGGHVDHQLVHDAAVEAVPGHRLLFYEDLPYACRAPEASLQRSGNPHSHGALLLPSERAGSGLKRRYALCYPSQIAGDVANEMEAYADGLHGRERFFGHEATLQRLARYLGHQEPAHA